MVQRGLTHSRFQRFAVLVLYNTPFLKMLALLVTLWLLFSGALYWCEQGVAGSTIKSYGNALYWGIAAFSTAGIADTPQSGAAQLIGGIWIVIGSALFFGTIVATITMYFMRPLHHPEQGIIDAIEYNLERLDELSIEELDLLKETVDLLIVHVEKVRASIKKPD